MTATVTAQADGRVQLDRAAVARRAGYSSAGTVTTLLSRARERRRELGSVQAVLFPEPDGHLGRTPFWYEATIDRYLSERSQPGQPASPQGQHQADAGPGICPICEKPCPGSVASHRKRRAACSYDEGVRKAAAVYSGKWLAEKAKQDRPGRCPICGRVCEGSVTAHRNGRHECSFDPVIRAAATR